LLIIGGRTNSVNEELGLEIYDTENSEWYRFSSIQRFRAASWLFDSNLYVYGGFDCASPNVPTDEITKIHLPSLFKGNEVLLKKAMNRDTSYGQKVTSPKDMSNSTTPNISPNTSFNEEA